jgi:hypothetical protein
MPQLPPELRAMFGGAGESSSGAGNPLGVSPEMLKEMGGMKGLQQQAAAMWKHMDQLAAKDPAEYSVCPLARSLSNAPATPASVLHPASSSHQVGSSVRLAQREVFFLARVRTFASPRSGLLHSTPPA